MLPCVGEDDLPRKADNSIDKIRYAVWVLAAKFPSVFAPLAGRILVCGLVRVVWCVPLIGMAVSLHDVPFQISLLYF